MILSDSGKMSGTPSQNPWKTMGCKSLREPMAEPGTEGYLNQNHRKPMAEQCREEGSEINTPRNILTPDAGWRTGKSETTLRRPTPIKLSGWRYPRSQMPLISGWGFSSVECFAHSIPAYRVFLDPAAQLTDGLLETNCDLCRHEAVNPPPGVFL
jgi:hypothetical protein